MGSTHPNRWLILEWDGATPALLQRLAEAEVMPTWAGLCEESSFWRLNGSGGGSPTAAWTTLRTGGGPERHGVWDESRLDARRGWVIPWDESSLPCPALPELLTGGPSDGILTIHDRREARGIWERKPASLEELTVSVQRTAEVLNSVKAQAQQAAAGDWRLLEIRVQVLAFLQHRLWSLLDGEELTRRSPWSTAAQEAFRALDRSLEHFWQLAQQHGATLVVTSPYGFVPFREKVTLVELLRQQGLLVLANGYSKLAYRTRRWLWRWRRRLGREAASQGVHGPVRSLLPLDWRRSRVVTLHGQHAAIVYLNTPERFGTRVLTTASAREEALGETLATLREARHPVTGEPLFAEVLATSTDNPDQPDVVARPAPGLLTRHKPDHRRHLLRSDPSLSAIQGGDGLLLVQGLHQDQNMGVSLPLTAVASTLVALSRKS